MSRLFKIITGLMAFAPLILMVAIFVLNSQPQTQYVPGTEVDNLGTIVTYLFTATAFVIYVVTFFIFGLHLRRNPRALSGLGIFWIWMLLLCGGISFPVYWYKHIWSAQA